jgi:gliding motility-associated-like protein
VICLGAQSILSGSGALTYSWSGGISDNAAFTPSVTSSYTLTGTDANNCIGTAVTTVTVNDLPVLLVTASSSISCEAESTTLTVSGASSYTWSSSETSPSIVITPSATTQYTILATDANTCTNSLVYTQSVTPCPGTFTAYALTTNVTCNGKNDGKIMIQASSSYTDPVLSYFWNPSSLCPGNNCDSVTHLQSGSYSVLVKITYTLNNILVKTDSLLLDPIVIMDLNGECEIKVYKGITANSDGLNDVLTIENIEEFPENTVSVFNRWGVEVFKAKGYNNKDKVWPLKDEASHLQPGTYFYIIDLGNGDKPLKGWVELIKN